MFMAGKAKLIAGLVGVVIALCAVCAVGSTVYAHQNKVILPPQKQNSRTYYEVKSKAYYQALQKASGGNGGSIIKLGGGGGGNFSTTQKQVIKALNAIIGTTYSKAWVKSQLHLSTPAMVSMIYEALPGAISNYIEYNLFPSFQLSQMGEESGWGTSYEAKTDHDYTGISCFPPSAPYSVWPGAIGTGNPRSSGGGYYVKYPNLNAFMGSYGKSFTTNKRFTNVTKQTTPFAQCRQVADDGWCGSSHAAYAAYADRLIGHINQNNLTVFDEIAEKVKAALASSNPGNPIGSSTLQKDFPGWNVSSLKSFLAQLNITLSSLPQGTQTELKDAWQYVGDPYLYGGGHGDWGGTTFTKSAVDAVCSAHNIPVSHYTDGYTMSYDHNLTTGTSSNPVGGALSLNEGKPSYDCSGYVSQVLHDIGKLKSPLVTTGLARYLPSISSSELKIGDIVEVDGDSHVAIYIGKNSYGVVVLQGHKSGYAVGPGYLWHLKTMQCFGLPN